MLGQIWALDNGYMGTYATVYVQQMSLEVGFPSIVGNPLDRHDIAFETTSSNGLLPGLVPFMESDSVFPEHLSSFM